MQDLLYFFVLFGFGYGSEVFLCGGGFDCGNVMNSNLCLHCLVVVFKLTCFQIANLGCSFVEAVFKFPVFLAVDADFSLGYSCFLGE